MISCIIIEIILLACSFSGLYYFKTLSFIPQEQYLFLFLVYTFIWIIISGYYNRYQTKFNLTFRSFYRSLFLSTSLTMFFIVMFVAILDLQMISRLFLISIIAVPLLLELLVIGLIRKWLFVNKSIEKDRNETEVEIKKASLRLKWVVTGFVLFIQVFFLMIKLEYGTFYYYTVCEYTLIILLSSWIISSWLTDKYIYFPSRNLYYHIAPFIKSGFIMLILVGAMYFFFRLETFPRLVLFGTILVYMPLEVLIFSIILIAKQKETVFPSNAEHPNKKDSDIFGQQLLSIDPQIEIPLKRIDIRALFKRVSLQKSDTIVKFLLKHVNNNLERDSATLLSTTSIDNIRVLADQSQNLLINLHPLNDIRRLNEYLIACSDKMKPGGILFGCFIPLEMDRKNIRSKMPGIIFFLFYPIHFFFYRIFPKLPKIRHLYFVITNGRNRVISKAEIFGRLSCCGYKIIAEKIINNKLYFISKKLLTVSTEEEPSYSTIVRLKRIGYNGQIITLHKFRTMHPYSEFIQEDLYNNQGLDTTGDKVIDDLRLTSWGKVLRKYWLDELPQIYDWIQGKITIVGVRPLSEAKYKLYPADLQQKRVENKPGMIPPYYADLPKSFDEFMESERRYLKHKQEKRYLTDFVYFWKAVQNILFRGARSR